MKTKAKNKARLIDPSLFVEAAKKLDGIDYTGFVCCTLPTNSDETRAFCSLYEVGNDQPYYTIDTLLTDRYTMRLDDATLLARSLRPWLLLVAAQVFADGDTI